MINIHEILKDYGLEIPTDKKAEFDKLVADNYKTVAEVDKISKKLSEEIESHKETKETLEATTAAFEELKASGASAEEWEKKYTNLVEENRKKEEDRAKIELEIQERADFDNYFAENKKEWVNPMTADGYFSKYKEAKALPENKSKTTADILHSMTKDDATAFKVVQPDIVLKGSNIGIDGTPKPESIPTIF